MIKPISLFIISLFSILFIAGNTVAAVQMRPNVPDVLEPPAAEELPDPGPVIDRFRQANIRHEKPRILIFWNRQLSDEVAARYQASVTIDANSSFNQSGSANSAYGAAGGYVEYQQNAGANSRVVLADRNYRIDPVARAQLDELTDWEIQGAFTSTFLSGGARPIDRNMIIRTTGKDAASNDEVNTYALETESMLGKADLLMEILLAASDTSPTGVAFQTTVKDINTGEIVVMLNTPAEPPSIHRSHYVATRSGFVREEETVGDSLADVGRTLALQAMTALSDSWAD